MSSMLPRAQRLSASRHVVAVVRQGDSFKGRHMRIVSSIQKDAAPDAPGRGTVVVSKKTAKLAVTRNRLKRRVRGALSGLGLPKGVAVVIFPNLSTLAAPYSEIQADIAGWLSKRHPQK